jgi:hypothetical protein
MKAVSDQGTAPKKYRQISEKFGLESANGYGKV